MFDWSDERDARLREERGVGFQDVVLHIEQGDTLAVSDHPNREKYPNQQIMYVRIGDYVYLVPFVRTEGKVFLKTIIPSSKATQRFLK